MGGSSHHGNTFTRERGNTAKENSSQALSYNIRGRIPSGKGRFFLSEERKSALTKKKFYDLQKGGKEGGPIKKGRPDRREGGSSLAHANLYRKGQQRGKGGRQTEAHEGKSGPRPGGRPGGMQKRGNLGDRGKKGTFVLLQDPEGRTGNSSANYIEEGKTPSSGVELRPGKRGPQSFRGGEMELLRDLNAGTKRLSARERKR